MRSEAHYCFRVHFFVREGLYTSHKHQDRISAVLCNLPHVSCQWLCHHLHELKTAGLRARQALQHV